MNMMKTKMMIVVMIVILCHLLAVQGQILAETDLYRMLDSGGSWHANHVNSLPSHPPIPNRVATAPKTWADVDAFIKSVMNCTHVPGLALSVVKNGKILYNQTFGYRDVNKNLKVDADTIFGIGSTTKAFTSLLTGMLVDEGKMSFDGLVKQYLPLFQLRDPSASEIVTMRDLLSHRTGLPRHDIALFSSNSTLENLAFLARFLEPSTSIRNLWQYNNWMVVVAGYIAGILGQSTWDDMVRDRIFSPLGMSSSFATFKDAESFANKAMPTYYDPKTKKWITASWSVNYMVDPARPAGSICSNLKDMSKWMNYHLGHGVRLGVSNATLEDIHAPWMLIKTLNNVVYPDGLKNLLVGESYGLTWSRGPYRNRKRVFHDGDVVGEHTLIWLLPDEDVGIFITSNAGNAMGIFRQPIASFVADFVLGLEPMFADASVACAFPCNMYPSLAVCPKPKRASTVPQSGHSVSVVNLLEYVGNYSNPGYGALKVFIDPKNTAQLQFTYRNYPAGNLVSTEGDMFKTTSPIPALFDFSRNVHSKIVSLVFIHGGDYVYRTSFTNDLWNAYNDHSSCSYPYHAVGSSDNPVITGPQGPEGPVGAAGAAGVSSTRDHMGIGGIIGLAIACSFLAAVTTAFVLVRFTKPHLTEEDYVALDAN